MNLVEEFEPLFYSLVIFCAFYATFLAFYVNEKAGKLNLANKLAIRRGKEEEKEEINKKFKKKRLELANLSVQILKFTLLTNLLVNGIIIVVHSYYKITVIVGGIILPVFWYIVFVLFLWIAIGLKGQRVLQTGRFLKGLDY